MDVGLLIAGLVRVMIWGYGFYLAYTRRNWLLTFGFGFAATNGLIFAFSNAGAHLPGWLTTLSVILATPITALIVGAYLLRVAGKDKDTTWLP